MRLRNLTEEELDRVEKAVGLHPKMKQMCKDQILFFKWKENKINQSGVGYSDSQFGYTFPSWCFEDTGNVAYQTYELKIDVQYINVENAYSFKKEEETIVDLKQIRYYTCGKTVLLEIIGNKEKRDARSLITIIKELRKKEGWEDKTFLYDTASGQDQDFQQVFKESGNWKQICRYLNTNSLKINKVWMFIPEVKNDTTIL